MFARESTQQLTINSTRDLHRVDASAKQMKRRLTNW